MIEIIIFSAAFGYVFAEASKIPQNFAHWLFRKGIYKVERRNMSYIAEKDMFIETNVPYSLKPFTCGLCLSFWTGFVSSLIYSNFNLPESLGVGFTASLIAVLIKSVDDRLNR